MANRIVVTGGNGFVAGSVIRQAGGGCELHVLSRGPAPVLRPSGVWHEVEMSAEWDLRAAVDQIAPRAVIHLAALADIDYCEAHPEQARRANTELTAALARICADQRCRMVYVSTDTVFDGKRGMYTETDAPGPINVYAETKAAAERAVARTAPDWVVARLALVVGLPMLGEGNSFLARMIPVLEAHNTLGAPDQEIRTPIDVVTAGRALLELAQNDYSGYLHLAGNDRLNRCEMMRRIASYMGFDQHLVVPRNPENIPGRAPRPLDVSMDNTLARRVLQTPMLDLERALALIMAYRQPKKADDA